VFAAKVAGVVVLPNLAGALLFLRARGRRGGVRRG